jgi:hypothetical protein
MTKLSSYKKMKLKYEAEIRELTNEIIALVEDKDIEKTTIIKLQWKVKLAVENQIFA